MSDRMRPLSFGALLACMRGEYARHGSIFGIDHSRFYHPSQRGSVYGQPCALPLGPAAGPHTQLSQNIIAAYLAGARVFELKTVQVLDQLEIDKPCIEAADEGYNTEWSTELSVDDACREYINAWVVLHVLQALTGGGEQSDFVFNMSVGYDLEGLQSPKIDGFIEALKDARAHSAFAYAQSRLSDAFGHGLADTLGIDADAVAAPGAEICTSVTLSTMHGCPAGQIEALCAYLLECKGLDVYVKLNPTLLGYADVRAILDGCGFSTVQLTRESFEHDLQYADALTLIDAMQQRAAARGRRFGVKLSNTLPVTNTRGVLPGEEMYLSGRALYPLTVELAARLAAARKGDLAISFSGGASQANVAALVAAGVSPVTVATDLLKPGGYYRLTQMAARVDELGTWDDAGRVDAARLAACAEDARGSAAYRRATLTDGAVHVERPLPIYDCYIAPCVAACPLAQDVPDYARLLAEGRYFDALEVIYARNPLPHITGHICDHACEFACTRWDYDSPVCIRDLKRIAAEHGHSVLTHELKPHAREGAARVAIMGAGPSGLAAAAFLARAGLAVTVFDRAMRAGGVVQNVIPAFRLPQTAIDRDLELLRRAGVEFELGCEDELTIERLHAEGFAYIYLAIGAATSIALELDGDNENVCAAIDFLWQCKGNTEVVRLGPRIAVVGGGNSAMDSARAALREEGVETVYLLYRRARAQMPADREEFENALADGVVFKELRQPVAFHSDGRLVCAVMELGEPDESGRRRPVPVEGEFEVLEIDALITAIGEGVDAEFLAANGLEQGRGRTIAADADTLETNLPDVFAGGDMRQGPASVVRAIADARRAADEIIRRAGLEPLPGSTPDIDREAMKSQALAHRGRVLQACVTADGHAEAQRCLACNVVCDKCVDVCPNRANIAVPVPAGEGQFGQRAQILHIDAWCNECGNCETFCPYNGSPYRDKFTLYASAQEFLDGDNDGFGISGNGNGAVCALRVEGDVCRDVRLDEPPEDLSEGQEQALAMVRAVRKEYPWLLTDPAPDT